MAIGFKTGGRVKGTLNKKTTALKELVENYLGKSLPESILDDIRDADLGLKVNAKLELMRYMYSPQKPVDSNGLPPGVDISLIQQITLFLQMPREQLNELIKKSLIGTDQDPPITID